MKENKLETSFESQDYIDRLGGLINAKNILKNTIRIENMVVKGKTVIEGISSSERIKFHVDKVESYL
jgi:hypothetical protein